jgi:ADP-ribosylglycohydrolase
MRVSPIGWMFNSVENVLGEARMSAECTHNDPEGIKGAQAVALAVFYARKGKSKDFIKGQLEKRFKYDLTRKLSSFKRSYKFEVSCQKSVPEAIICFLESKDYIDAVRNAVALGGDADTQAAIAGSIAEAYYKYIPLRIVKKAWKLLPQKLKTDLLNHCGSYKKHINFYCLK